MYQSITICKDSRTTYYDTLFYMDIWGEIPLLGMNTQSMFTFFASEKRISW